MELWSDSRVIIAQLRQRNLLTEKKSSKRCCWWYWSSMDSCQRYIEHSHVVMNKPCNLRGITFACSRLALIISLWTFEKEAEEKNRCRYIGILVTYLSMLKWNQSGIIRGANHFIICSVGRWSSSWSYIVTGQTLSVTDCIILPRTEVNAIKRTLQNPVARSGGISSFDNNIGYPKYLNETKTPKSQLRINKTVQNPVASLKESI